MSLKSLLALAGWLLGSLCFALPAQAFFGGETGTLDVDEDYTRPTKGSKDGDFGTHECKVYLSPANYRLLYHRLNFKRSVAIPGYHGLTASRQGDKLMANFGSFHVPIVIDAKRAPQVR